jgi:hypothetical protein
MKRDRGVMDDVLKRMGRKLLVCFKVHLSICLKKKQDHKHYSSANFHTNIRTLELLRMKQE